jgi:hypothetical protein
VNIAESVERFPSVKSFAVFCLVAWVLTGLLLAAGGVSAFRDAVAIDPSIDRLADKWLDALNWLTAACVFGIVGKHVAAKPEMVRAEADAEAKKVLAKAEAEAVVASATHPVQVAAQSLPDPSNLVRLEQTSAVTARDMTRRDTSPIAAARDESEGIEPTP